MHLISYDCFDAFQIHIKSSLLNNKTSHSTYKSFAKTFSVVRPHSKCSTIKTNRVTFCHSLQGVCKFSLYVALGAIILFHCATLFHIQMCVCAFQPQFKHHQNSFVAQQTNHLRPFAIAITREYCVYVDRLQPPILKTQPKTHPNQSFVNELHCFSNTTCLLNERFLKSCCCCWRPLNIYGCTFIL